MEWPGAVTKVVSRQTPSGHSETLVTVRFFRPPKRLVASLQALIGDGVIIKKDGS